MERTKVLCVCFGNTCRSPMFQALLQQRIPEVTVESAGLADREGAPASENAQICMREMGLDLSQHKSRSLRQLDLSSFTHFFCMDAEMATKLTSLGVSDKSVEVIGRERGGVPNPWGGSIDDYRACASFLAAEAERIAARLG